jgi:hypothetical protein
MRHQHGNVSDCQFTGLVRRAGLVAGVDQSHNDWRRFAIGLSAEILVLGSAPRAELIVCTDQ